MPRRFALMVTALTSLLAARAAGAEPETVEGALREPIFRGFERPGFGARGFALVGADVEGGTAAVGGELKLSARDCDYLVAGGQVRAAIADGAQLSAEQWASACLPIRVMDVGHHLEWDVRPSLLAPLGLRAGRNRRETLHFHWQPLRGPLPAVLGAIERGEAKRQGLPPPAPRTAEEDARLPQGDLIIFDVSVRHTRLWSADAPDDVATLEQVEALPVAYARGKLFVEVMSGGGEFNDHGSLIHVWLTKIEQLTLGPVRATGGIGVVTGSAGPFVDAVSREVSVTTPRAVLGLAVGDERRQAELRATRDVTLAPDGYVTLDSRLALSLAGGGPRTWLSFDSALARTEAHVPGRALRIATTGGVALTLARRLTPRLEASARLEVARSFYATPDLLEVAPGWGATGFAVLQATIGR